MPLSMQMGAYQNQKNSWVSPVLGVLGSIVGGIYGGPMGAAIGNTAGRQAGYGLGNVFAGRDAFNGGTGDFWDNLNPFSKYGLGSISASPLGGMLVGGQNGKGLLG